MPTIYFVTQDGTGGEEVLAKAILPYIPRKGETVVLNDLRLREDETLPHGEQRVEPQSVFEVCDVTYEFDACFTIGSFVDPGGQVVSAKPAMEKDVEVQVWLTLPPGEAVWPGLKRKED